MGKNIYASSTLTCPNAEVWGVQMASRVQAKLSFLLIFFHPTPSTVPSISQIFNKYQINE